jgi:inosine-uridine nucleoside N-ribohydrolase
VATFLRDHPEAASRIDRISVMGGAIGLGNWTPSAEFNILADPEAAEIVIGSGVPVTLVPLEVTHRALATEPVLARISALGTPVAAAADALLRFFTDAYREVFGFEAPAVHDPCAVAAVIDPSIVPTRHLNVAIETESELTAGRSVVDVHGRTGRTPNVDVAMDLDVARFWDLVIAALASYREPMPARG